MYRMAKKKVKTTAERIVNALETIAYQNEQLIHIKYVLKEHSELLKLQTKCLVFLTQFDNTNTTTCDKYKEYLEEELKKCAPQPFAWKGKDWSK